MKSTPILIIDDKVEDDNTLSDALMRAGYSVECTTNAPEGLDKVGMNGYGMVIIDQKVPEFSCTGLLRKMKQNSSKIPVVVITSHGSVQSAVEAMQEGASDYLVRPCPPGLIEGLIEKYVKNGKGNNGNGRQSQNKKHLVHAKNDTEIITQDTKLKKILALTKTVASSDATVLIQGESGTGKELLAEYIHRHSGRNKKPMVALNCAALPENLAESELFGYEKGAFTGATNRRIGKFEQANNGTLLLDEISEMPLRIQAKLLRAIQQRQIDRIGGSQMVSINTRIIAITNIDLKKAVQEEKFREDLFYRINVIPFIIPPLRKRKKDIPLLANYFIRKYCSNNGKRMKEIDEKAMELLVKKAWKGNIRELENCIERAVLLTENERINPEYLFLENDDFSRLRNTKVEPGITVKDMEKKLIFGTLAQMNENRTRAAEMLGISIRTLRNKLKQYKDEM